MKDRPLLFKDEKLKVLFVCSMAKLRSKTAAHCVGGIDGDYAGTDKDSERPVTKEKMDWADIIVCMENSHRSKLRRKFKWFSGKIKVWGIPDNYDYMDDILVSQITGRAWDMFDKAKRVDR